jgi:hypothetical protein
MEIITDFAGGNAILARNFLRHRVGRHFADAVTNEGFLHAGALSHRIQEAACEQWVRSCLGRLFFEGDGDALYPNDPARNAPNPL